MKCPRCEVELIVGKAGDLEAHGCSNCGGVWLSNADSQRVVKGLSAKSLDAVRALSEKAEAEVDTSARDLSCPGCAKALVSQRVAKAWLDVDICATCGTWFDAGEVERITKAMNPAATDWRSAPTVDGGPKPKPMIRTGEEELEVMDMRSPYLRGFGNILRSLWATFTETDQYTTEADIDVDIGGVRFTVHLEADGANGGFDNL